MRFLIADTFTDSLARLTGDEQKAVKTTAFDLQLNPANPGLKFHRMNRAKDRNFCSVRVSRDIRLIVHKTNADLLLCYVDHHDNAYAWAERRRIEKHPRTGAAQLVEIRETVKEIAVPKYVEAETPAPPKLNLFANVSDEDLIGFGVPKEWVAEVRVATEDTLLGLTDHLPDEAAEALLDLATGETPKVLHAVPEDMSPFDHPDAQRRFRIMTNVEELERALDIPWEKWAVFLHPAQREVVERAFNGPARVSGSAGTGKTIVALHRAVHLARRNPSATVLVTTFSQALANALRVKVRQLARNEPTLMDRISVFAINTVGIDLYTQYFEAPQIADTKTIRAVLAEASATIKDHRFTDRFLWAEWDTVIDAWQLQTWVDYRGVARLGRKTRLGENHRKALWTIFEHARSELSKRGLTTIPNVFNRVTEQVAKIPDQPYDFAVVDEAQDMSVPQLRFLSALACGRKEALFFSGDLGQRIFQTPFSWKSLGVDIRGRSYTLRINYRTSHQIRRQADRLLPNAMSDVDGNVESRRRTVSVFNGPEPTVVVLSSQKDEIKAVSDWLKERSGEQIQLHEIAVIVRSDGQLPRARKAVEDAGLTLAELGESAETEPGRVSLCTMHLAKGLEFRAVVVMACDDDVIPLQERIEAVGDDADLQDVYDTERHLLYVACTRARDHLLITGVDPASEFLDDISGKGAGSKTPI